ncbi:MAG TPA: thiamine pyrophosphate-dependent enzyme [Candidatus Thalassarchaeaceae archaeon]|nr:thiamine pyrophosphate-dependent enzyme [Candidatus Thalassarchaeaceae archaeon]
MDGRQGIWKCPDCSMHQLWKTRAGGTNRLDRTCKDCGNRARVTIERSRTGRGRLRKVEIWERPHTASMEDLEKEVESRNASKLGENGGLRIGERISEIPTQADLPTIWGADWTPKRGLNFPRKLDASRVRSELLIFIAERHDGHLGIVSGAWDSIVDKSNFDGDEFHYFSIRLVEEIGAIITERLLEPKLSEIREREVIPMRNGELFLSRRGVRFLRDVTLCMRRIAHYASITLDDRVKWQRWMTRTRLVDEELKSLFGEGLTTPDGGSFGGKGFRSTWQEGIVACASTLRRAVDMPAEERHLADVVAPMIRDVGLALAMGQTPIEVFSAQMGKADSYMNGGHVGYGGRDLHIGNWEKRILPPTAPLPIASATTTGVALASKITEAGRFHLAPVGEGCSSSGEFWEAMNLAGTRGLPICFMIQNNQIALDTFVSGQSGAETFGDKGHAMGIPAWTIDGSDPASFYSSTATAREFALSGGGATLVHVETMRGCGHAHHHDDLYLGASSGNPPGYVDRDLLTYWSEKDPLPNHRELIVRMGCSEEEITEINEEELALVSAARREVELMEWPEGHTVTRSVTSLYDAQSHEAQLSRISDELVANEAGLKVGESSLEFSNSANSWTYSKAIQNGLVDLAEKYGDEIVFMGEDMEIAGAFGINLPLKSRGHQDKLLDMPLSESIIVNSAAGAALGGMRPVAEIQFGGFAALAMNALVNNAAQLRWRWGAEVPMTIRIPLGGKTRSGPFHANMIESWFTNDPGLVVVSPSTPQDAYDLLIESHSLNDPVVFLEHIGLYGLRGGKTGWGESINQLVDTEAVHRRIAESKISIGSAKVIRGGRDLTIVTWGAMVHVAMDASSKMAKKGIEVEVIDIRTLVPFDSETCIKSVQRTGRLLVLQESQWSGGFGHTICSRIVEESFWRLEYPPVVIGSLDTPVPFSPTLEDHTIPSSKLVERHIERACE